MQLKHFIVTGFIAASTLFALPQNALAAEIRIATGDYAPFTEATDPTGGVVNEFVSKIVDRAGMSGTFKFNPWKRSLELTRAGRYDATSFWYFSPEREADFIHVGPVMQER